MALSDALLAIANRHRAVALGLISGSDETLEIKVSAPRSQTAGAALFADLASSKSSIIKGPFPCLWSHSINNAGEQFAFTSVIGKYPQATCYAKLYLEHVLVDPEEPLGETWLDLAKEVIHNDRIYEVLGTERFGLSNVPPYVLLVVLSGEVHRRA